MRRLALVLAAFFTLTGFAAADPTWVEVHSLHFTVLTDAGEKRGREVLIEFEQMRATFALILHRDEVNSPLPLKIVAFRNTKEMRQFSPLWKGKPIELSGYFQPGEDSNYILLDLSQENALPAVFHEYAHSLLNANFPPTPLWFDEGIAQYFSTLQLSGGKVQLGLWPEHYNDLFSTVNLMPTAIILEVGHDSPYYNESGDHRHMFYAQSWLMVHYLYDKNRLADFEKYRKLVINQHEQPATAFQQAFGMDVKQFDNLIFRHLHGSEMLMYSAPLKLPNDLQITSRAYSENEQETLFAEIHQHLQDYQGQAITEYRGILAKDPQNAAAHRGLGYALLRKGELAQAGEQLEQAAQLDPNDARTQYFAALLGQTRGDHDHDHMVSMQEHLEKAVALNPQYADAYHLLAFVHLIRQENDACLAAEERAVQLSPRNEDYRVGLGNCLMQLKRFDDAQQLFTDLSHSSTPRIASEAASMLEQVERMREYEKQMVQLKAPLTPTTVPVSNDNLVPPPPNTPGTTANTPPARAVHGSVRFLKGKLIKVDCSQPPAAVLEVQAENTLWHIATPDAAHALTIGADSLSCSWVNKAVSVNFYPGDGNTGKLLSVELSSGK